MSEKKNTIIVKYTNNYDKFYFLPMNRLVAPSHVSKLVRSIKELGVLRPVIICETDVVDGKLRKWVLDGQHLFTGLTRLEWNIPYINLECNSIEDMISTMSLLNASSKSWIIADYVRCWQYFHNDYRKLEKEHRKFDISYDNLCVIHKSSSKDLKQGKFKMSNNDSEIICKYISELLILLPANNRWMNSRFVKNFMKFYDTAYYDHTKIKQRVTKYKSELSLVVDEDSLVTFFKDKLFIK